MTKYTVPADFNQDGILTEDEVQQMLNQLQAEFPHGSYLGDAIFPSEGHLPVGTPGWRFASPDGIYYHSQVLGAGGDCIAWAYYVSDRIFGDLPYRTIDRNQWELEDLRVGDVFYCEGSHINAIIDTTCPSSPGEERIRTTDSGSAHKVIWGAAPGTKAQHYQGTWDVRTRYPQ